MVFAQLIKYCNVLNTGYIQIKAVTNFSNHWWHMSVTELDLISQTKKLGEEVTRPFPRSKKIFVKGSNDSIRVGMREVGLRRYGD